MRKQAHPSANFRLCIHTDTTVTCDFLNITGHSDVVVIVLSIGVRNR